MQKYDIENLLNDIKSVLVLNLNNAIDAVEAEKIAQGLPTTGILSVDVDKGYFEQSWSDAILNINPAIFYGIESVAATGIGPASIQVYKIFIDIILLDSGQDALAKNRIHRYTRAIKDVIEANYDRWPSAAKTKIETISPISFKLDLNSSETIKVGGILLTTALA